MIRILAVAVFGLLFALYEVAVVSFLPPWVALRPLLPFCVMLVVGSTRSRALAAALAGGLVLDAYALGHVEFALVRLPITVLLLAFTAGRVLTNRSVYATAALAVLARLLDWSGAWLFSAVTVFLNVGDRFWSFPTAPVAILAWDVLSTAVAFLLLASFTGRFMTRPTSSYGTR